MEPATIAGMATMLVVIVFLIRFERYVRRTEEAVREANEEYERELRATSRWLREQRGEDKPPIH